MTEPRGRAGRRTPAILTSIAALATGFTAGPVAAQVGSFNGTPTVVSGSVTMDRGAAVQGTDLYTINSRTAVIDFRPTDTAINPNVPINFQNSGTTARFVNGADTQTFTVLNRIVPVDGTRPVQFNGTVVSELRNGTNVSRGGDVWFYSPGGIILGARAVFDIGNLLLTSADPTRGGGVIDPASPLRGGGARGSMIDIQQGASIRASAEGSYVALIAPAIRQSGTVRVNGSAAYVAAEAATISIANGLFDITVETGTDTGGGLPLIHRGTTGGPSSTGAADPHRIYMVAVPKNDAITLLVGETSRLGFDVATVAGVENGRVVLSSGYDIRAGAIGSLLFSTDGAGIVQQRAPSDLRVSGGAVTSNFFGRAWTNADIASTTAATSFTGDVTLRGGARAQVAARRPGETVSIGGNLTVSTNNGVITNRQSGSQVVLDASGGGSLVFADNGGTLIVGGSATVTSDATYFLPPNASAGPLRAAASGGRAAIFASGGTVRIGGAAAVSASASFDNVPATFVPMADLRGGTAGINTAEGGVIQLNGASNTISANALSGLPGSVGDRTGGVATLTTGTGSGGRITTTGGVTISSTATDTGATGAGAARGGRVTVSSLADPITIGGALIANATATAGGGDVGVAGDAQGGEVVLASGAAGSVTVRGLTALDASARGGVLRGAAQGDGGQATGGSVLVLSDGVVALNGVTSLQAGAIGGDNLREGPAGGAGGTGAGGSTEMHATTGSIAVGGDLILTSVGTGGAARNTTGSVNGGDGRGGGARISSTGASGRITASRTTILDASGVGGAGAGPGGRGGVGEGGSFGGPSNGTNGASVSASGGQATLSGAVVLSANGTGGAGSPDAGGVGGAGTAGATGLFAISPATTNERSRLTTGALTMNATGTGGAGATVGRATAGSGSARVDGGDLSLASLTFRSAGLSPSRPGFDVSATNGGVSVTGLAALTVAGVFTLNGPFSAPTIAITARGIDLTQGARLGGADTRILTLSSFDPARTMFIGGDDVQGEDYSISASELTRMQANQITLRAQPGTATAPSNVVVRNATLTGSAGSGATNLIGSNALFRISGDVVRVEGGVSLTGAGATDMLSLVGARRVEVVTDRGGALSVTGPGTGAPLAGTVSLAGPIIGVGTSALLARLAADPRFSERDALLAAPAATPRPEGFVQADRLSLITSNVAVIQNSGTDTVFAGFTTGPGGVEISRSPGADPTVQSEVVIYGRVQRPGGAFSAGGDASVGAAFATGQQTMFGRATVNGCAVGASCLAEPATIVTAVSAIEEVLAASQSAAVEVPAIRVVQIVDQDELASEPVITEPVAGAGNASLWDSEDDEDDDDDGGAVAARPTQ